LSGDFFGAADGFQVEALRWEHYRVASPEMDAGVFDVLGDG